MATLSEKLMNEKLNSRFSNLICAVKRLDWWNRANLRKSVDI